MSQDEGGPGRCSYCGQSPVKQLRPSESPTGRGRFRDYDDHCIADLPHTSFACCGHGDERAAYVMIGPPRRSGGSVLYGRAAIILMKLLGGKPPCSPELDEEVSAALALWERRKQR